MTLDAYLTRNGMTNGEFAALVQTDPTTISRLRRGKLNPAFDMQRRIRDATRGEVMPNDFLDTLAPADAGATP